MTLSEIPGLDSLLAGYDVFGTYANTESTKEVLFTAGDLEEFTFRGQSGDLTFLKPAWVRHERIYTTDTWSKSAVTEHDYTISVSSRTKVSGSYGAFKGEVDASFSKDQQGSSSVVYSAYEEIIVVWQLSQPNDDPRTRLTAKAKADIDGDMIPATLIATYGTHYVKGLQVGGKAFRYSTTSTTKYTSSTSIDVAAKMSYKNAAGKLSADEKATYKSAISSFDSSSETLADSRGGSVALASDVFDGQYAAWSASVEQNPVLVDFPQDDALVGIWTLASTKTRQDAIKAEHDAQSERLTCVQYGDQVYLKVQVTDLVRYLTGGRSTDNESVYTRSTTGDPLYLWKFCKDTTNNGSGVLHYGDSVALRVTSRDDRWLTGGRHGEHEDVYTKDPRKEPTNLAYYTWLVQKSRTETGTGPVRYEDAAEGSLFLKVQGADDRWLTGARSGDNESVYTKDGEHGKNADYYTWLVKRKVD